MHDAKPSVKVQRVSCDEPGTRTNPRGGIDPARQAVTVVWSDKRLWRMNQRPRTKRLKEGMHSIRCDPVRAILFRSGCWKEAEQLDSYRRLIRNYDQSLSIITGYEGVRLVNFAQFLALTMKVPID
jgi:hypothetical protein